MDHKKQTTRSNDSPKAINLPFQETDSERYAVLNADYSSCSETCSSNECIEFSSGQQVLNIVRQLKQIILKIHDTKIKEQVEKLISIICCFLDFAHQLKGDMPIPPLYAAITEENSVLIEWIFPDFRVGFNIEADPSESGVYIVSGKKFDGLIYSRKLEYMRDILLVFRYIFSNI